MHRRVEQRFYLGKRFDPKQLRAPSEEMILGSPFYISPPDLLTHVIILGMTGSGKTILGKIIIEEAALQGIPSILIDPKGDLASMKLVFPSLSGEDLIPWIEAGKGKDKEKMALRSSELYENKFLAFDIPKERLEEFNRKTNVVVLTPRSTAGIPLAISSLPNPPLNVKTLIESDPETVLDLIDTVVRALTMRLFATEPSERHRTEEKFLNSILRYAWENDIPLKGIDGLARLVELVENPPMKKIGVMEVDSYIPPRSRHELAVKINNLLVGVEQLWHLGISLDIDLILDIFSRDGKTPIIVFSLSEIPSLEDKIFIVSRIAYAVYEWMRRKGGSDEPRLLFYIDEIGGGGGKTAFFPIHPYNPPSKPPLMLLIKQARAFGVSCVFSTQNPGDIDYKGLSNCGTWIVGKLSTSRDRDKVLQGLGDIELLGAAVDRRRLEKEIASLRTGEFICKTKQGALEFFKERWLMSYHKTMTPREIKEITDETDRRNATATISSMSTERAFLKLNHPASSSEVRRHFREGPNIRVEKAKCNYMPLLSFKIKTGFQKRHPLLSKPIKKDLVYGPILVPLFKDELHMNYVAQVLGLEKIRTDDLSDEIDETSIAMISKKLTIQNALEEVSKELRPKIEQEIMDDVRDQIRAEKEKTIKAEEIDFKPKLDELDFERQMIGAQITDLKEQISQIKDELEKLEHDKAWRLRSGQPVVKIAQSITSRQQKIRKYDRQISRLQRKVKTFDFRSSRILDSQNRKIKLIEGQFNNLEAETFGEIKPGLASEDMKEILVPICSADVCVENGQIKKDIHLEWNGFNGATITSFSCYECGTRISPFSPVRLCHTCLEVLCEEHARICDDCGQTTCEKHSIKCYSCGNTFCRKADHYKTCAVCGNPICNNCLITCEGCGKLLCTEHHVKCPNCGSLVCQDCVRIERKFLGLSKKQKCRRCLQI